MNRSCYNLNITLSVRILARKKIRIYLYLIDVQVVTI